MAENELAAYSSQFSKENILSLTTAINASVNNYATGVEGGKLDLFLILASLSQAAYEVVVNALPTSKEEAEKNVDEMKVLADKFVTTIDETRKELKIKPASELMASAHTLAVVAEFYSRRRDDVIMQMIQETADLNAKASEQGLIKEEA